MKNLINLLVILLFGFALTFAQKGFKKGTYVISMDGKFDVVYPAGFGVPAREVSMKGKEESEKMIMFSASCDRGACLVSYNDYDPSLFNKKSIEQMFDDIVKSYLKENAKVISKKDVMLNGYKGKSVKFQSTNPNGGMFYERFDCYVIKPRLYQVGFVGYKKGEIDKKDILDYFNSFEFFEGEIKSPGYYLTDEEGELEISLPPGYGEPKKEVTPVETDAGKINMTMYMKESQTGLCLLAFNDYPPDIFDKKTTEKMLDDAMNGALNNQKATIISKQSLYHEQYPGLTFTCSSKVGNTTVYSRYDYCIKKPRLYQVGYMAYSKADLDKTPIKNYFRSFKLKEK